MGYISEKLRQQVRDRAHHRCEYCLMPDDFVYLHHEPDHVIAEKHGGITHIDNVAWACFHCNRHKGSDIGSIDPLTKNYTPLYNPRTQRWQRHFKLEDPHIKALTTAGRATVFLLQLNNKDRVNDRKRLLAFGDF